MKIDQIFWYYEKNYHLVIMSNGKEFLMTGAEIHSRFSLGELMRFKYAG